MTIHDLVEDWKAMKEKLEHQLRAIDAKMIDQHAPLLREKIKEWIVELDDLIIKYSFPI
ncbi:MAG: hypothetical protein JWM91_3058 [Rhodospirillales bacterium]|nr:hypothetical protein [Rhodospirillales bacterium]